MAKLTISVSPFLANLWRKGRGREMEGAKLRGVYRNGPGARSPVHYVWGLRGSGGGGSHRIYMGACMGYVSCAFVGFCASTEKPGKKGERT